MIQKRKYEIIMPLCILLFFFISITSIYSSEAILPIYYNNLHIKQLVWYIIGFIIFFLLLIIKNEKILKFSKIIYMTSIILLIIVLIAGNKVNNTRGWISLGAVSFQPSELAKIGLILYISKIINDFRYEENNLKNEILLILKVLIITLIPSILVFIEPDTGAVISYIIILFTLLLVSEIRLKTKILIIAVSIMTMILIIIFYIKFSNEFIKLFGSSIYYRILRIKDWKNSSGMQLENSIITISTSKLAGMKLNNLPLYIPEPYTDFIFSVYTNAFGLIGAITLIFFIFLFDMRIINIALKTSKTINKYILIGFLISFLYPQIQNISMTIGLLPITGIPLPFISYGGSSLITSFIMCSYIINAYNT